jgi:hypothetical protein
MRKRSLAVLSALAILAGLAATVAAVAASSDPANRSSARKLTGDAAGQFEALEAADQYAEARTAPGGVVAPGAFSAAYAQAAALPIAGGAWTELTTKPYDSDAANYRDPVWSNSGGGSGLVGGRITALALDGSTVWAGAADGGVWKSTNGGGTWAPTTDDAPTLSTGALAIDPADHAVWAGTGEANTSSDSYRGSGVLRSADGGKTWDRVGGTELDGSTIGRLAFDGQGSVYAATSQGLWRHSAADTTSAWTAVLKPAGCATARTLRTVFVSDVVVRPGTGGKTVVAAIGWRGGSACNAFYESTDGGGSFTRLTLNGAINDADLGRTTLAYSADGSTLYALVQSAQLFNHPSALQGGTLLQGVFVSRTGEAAGQWNQIATAGKLAGNDSALQSSRGYGPGVQSWYNQFLAVDPANPSHLYVGLEEVYETSNGGSSWTTIGAYWNFGLPCYLKGGPSACPPTTHPDQHAIAIGGGKVYVGNDGGIYHRPLDGSAGWTDDNATLRTLQYYYAASGKSAAGEAFWGGLQDNGVSLLTSSQTAMVSPFGGDGGDLIVDPTDANKAVVEYVGLDMALTTNGGVSDGSTPAFREMTPSCSAFTYKPSPCDPSPRFIAPFEADLADPSHWVAGGRYVWDNGTKGWGTACSASACDWKIAYDTGAGHSITAVAVNKVTYVGWCGPCNAPFSGGLATNYGGTWHAISSPVLPNRFVAALTVDPADPAHVYAVYNGFSRRWVDNASIGHVFESTDGGATWTDISGNYPDVPSDDLVLVNGQLVVASDIGVFTAAAGQGAATTWSRYGSGLPNAATDDLSLTSDGKTITAATHGRGLWTIPVPPAAAKK